MGNNPMAIIDPTGGDMVPIGGDTGPQYCYTCGLNPGSGGGTGGGVGGGGGRSSANPFSPNHWSAQYRGSFNNGINQSSGGNLVINWNAIGQYGGEWNPMDGYHDYQNSLEQAIAIISYNERPRYRHVLHGGN